MGKLLDELFGVNGAFYLNEKCQVLDEGAAESLRQDVALINEQMAKDFGNPNFFRAITTMAQLTSNSGPLSDCSERAREMINLFFDFSRRWAGWIRKISEVSEN